MRSLLFFLAACAALPYAIGGVVAAVAFVFVAAGRL